MATEGINSKEEVLNNSQSPLCRNEQITHYGVFRCINKSQPYRLFLTDCQRQANHFLWEVICAKFSADGHSMERDALYGEFTVILTGGEVRRYFIKIVFMDDREDLGKVGVVSHGAFD